MLPTVRVHTTLGPDLLTRPELAPLLGQEVVVTLRPARMADVPPEDTEFVEECRQWVAAHGPVTAEEAREATAGVIGSLSDREED